MKSRLVGGGGDGAAVDALSIRFAEFALLQYCFTIALVCFASTGRVYFDFACQFCVYPTSFIQPKHLISLFSSRVRFTKKKTKTKTKTKKSLPRLCNDFGLRIIILKRENVAQHALALAVADAQAAARANSTKSVVLHFDDFQHVLDRVERQNAMLEYFANRAPPSCVLRLTFEELLSGSESSLLRVYQHINALDESQRPTAPPPSPPLPGNGSAEATEVPLRYAALPEPLLFDDVEKAPADFVVNWFAFRRRLSLVRHDLVFDLP